MEKIADNPEVVDTKGEESSDFREPKKSSEVEVEKQISDVKKDESEQEGVVNQLNSIIEGDNSIKEQSGEQSVEKPQQQIISEKPKSESILKSENDTSAKATTMEISWDVQNQQILLPDAGTSQKDMMLPNLNPEEKNVWPDFNS